jgi:hypothetical protein
LQLFLIQEFTGLRDEHKQAVSSLDDTASMQPKIVRIIITDNWNLEKEIRATESTALIGVAFSNKLMRNSIDDSGFLIHQASPNFTKNAGNLA